MFRNHYVRDMEPRFQVFFDRNVEIRKAYLKRKETKATYKSIGEDFGITRERVRQIDAKFQRMEAWQLRNLKPKDEVAAVLAKYGYDLDADFYKILNETTLFDDGPMQRELYPFVERGLQLKFFQVVFAPPKPEPPKPPPLPSSFSSLSLETQRVLNWHGIKSLLELHDWLVRITKRQSDNDTTEALLAQEWIGHRRTKEILAFAEKMQVWSNKRKPMSKRRTIK